ncbi:MAG: YdcF family protein, partial [Vicinamibacterales bacterium]
HEDPLSHADAIFVLAGTRTERWLEGVDLYRQGYAPVIVLSPGIVEPSEMWIRARGIRFPSDSELARDAMIQMGIPDWAIETPTQSVDNTADEALMLRRLIRANHWTRVIIVTSKYHTRRAGFAFRRALDGAGVTLIIRASHYDTSDPAHWWRHRSDLRFVLLEWEKLTAYWGGLAN